MSTTHPGGQVGYIGRNCTADDTQDNSWSNVAVNRQAEQQVWGEVMTGLHFTGCHIPACSLLSSRVHRLKDDKLTAHHTGYQASNDILRVLCVSVIVRLGECCHINTNRTMDLNIMALDATSFQGNNCDRFGGDKTGSVWTWQTQAGCCSP
ncbi:uncharacterized protein LOC127950733 isoform X2 [Carassius gibelio]|uniref:uncharacterized protein LOC127950733 isoform X2 n=1 Tax=Carassius gibelio TaxID=101364 RepID=UPI002279AFC3|nr:uncharacterized protein LOC127950733 isoform X2 [Carassius gibelio]